ncbi:hypothetical protein DUI87_08801 [Hirundo rustica rustica]|uniref:Uncharacterized protein n=1 Tax=Hirundo rustica rustica TaxID=333673 RepID=A0A3M0KM67_HIRRU|nr:hypothetical protein DUI87_08801 [Hirundo rustica rustica]
MMLLPVTEKVQKEWNRSVSSSLDQLPSSLNWQHLFLVQGRAEIQVPMDGIPSSICVSCTTELNVVCQLGEGALNLAVSWMEILNSASPNTDP